MLSALTWRKCYLDEGPGPSHPSSSAPYRIGCSVCPSLRWLSYTSYGRSCLVSVRNSRKFVPSSLTVLSRTGENMSWEFLADTPAHVCHFDLYFQDFTQFNLLPSSTVVKFPSPWLFGVTRGLLFHYVRKGNAILITIILFIDITTSEEPEPHQGWVFLLSSTHKRMHSQTYTYQGTIHSHTHINIHTCTQHTHWALFCCYHLKILNNLTQTVPQYHLCAAPTCFIAGPVYGSVLIWI